MSLKLHNMSSNYCIAMKPGQLLKLESLDFLDEVKPALTAAGAEQVEFSPHFGPNVFFTAKPAHAQAVMDTVKRLVNRRKSGAIVHPSQQHQGATP